MIQRYDQPLKVCSYCLKPGHTSLGCYEKPKKTLNTYNGLKVSSSFGGQRKPMNRVGKVAKKTNAATAKWKKTQPANHQGYWVCHYCLKWTKDPAVEHMESKTRRQDLRTVESNFTISCSDCNERKGSKSHDEIPHDCSLKIS